MMHGPINIKYIVKFASDGGESNPEQEADDLFAFWNFSPEEQEKRSVSNTLVSS